MKKLLIISQNFYPEIGSAGNRMKNIYKLLQARSIHVSVLTTHPTYPHHDLYKDECFWDEQGLGDDHVQRINITNRNNSISMFNRLLQYLEVACKMILFILKDKESYDVVFVTSPPIFIGIVGAVAKIRYNARFILDIRDLWPESLNGVGVLNHPIILFVFRFVERIIYRNSDEIVVNSKGFIDSIVKTGWVPPKKLSYIPNGALKKELAIQSHNKSDFRVVYAGNLGMAQDHQLLFELAKRLEEYSISLVLIGYGIHQSHFEKQTKAYQLKNISFIKPKTRARCLELIAQYSVGLVTLQSKEVFRTVLPGKIIDYMTCGLPIVAAVSGNAKSIIDVAKVGFTSESNSVDEMMQYILYLFNNPKIREQFSQNGTAYVKKHFLWEENIETLVELIEGEAGQQEKVEII
ncbi:glycosyltransferase WbuB [Anaerobacillus alkaliphilus]|uniref:Glycosyltransferase WbuB n=1 Tax=Anaerobacillus alkaliphilus TaxID=1548597 RepID=A0A4Q0VW10_9BACI|nr:glycosyltransferase family 4 protein [Anaerobacillus alkaliphilus]RXJ01670.1 glycosyltransferase WbuB [Anaerobacillus alkaliphilus]